LQIFYIIKQCYHTSFLPNFSKAWYNKGIALKAINPNSEADEAFAKAGEYEYKK
jgi:hypothetical protein